MGIHSLISKLILALVFIQIITYTTCFKLDVGEDVTKKSKDYEDCDYYNGSYQCNYYDSDDIELA